MKILIATSYFNYYSGSALYCFDLGFELVKRGHEVTILSECGGDMTAAAIHAGIRCVDFYDIHSISGEKFDVMHLNQKPPAEMALAMWKDTPAVATIHSELSYEVPAEHPNIKKYIGIRPTIVKQYEHLKPVLVYNGIDFERFNTNNQERIATIKKQHKSRQVALVVSTCDNLRWPMVQDLIGKSEKEGYDVWLVGKGWKEMKGKLPKNCYPFPETFFVEKFTEACDVTAGIYLGRTTIEGWACGKSGFIYDVDKDGKILKIDFVEPPTGKELEKFNIKHMVDMIEPMYKEIVTT